MSVPKFELASRRAERDAKRKGPVVQFTEKSYQLAHRDEWPLEWLDRLMLNDLTGACHVVVGDEAWADFMGTKPTLGDIKDLYQFLLNEGQGVGAGEASDSPDS